MHTNQLRQDRVVVDSSTGEIIIDEWTDYYEGNGADADTSTDIPTS